jgi:hypothetical protein
MPEAAIDEDGDTLTGEHDVRTDTAALEPQSVA